MSNVRTNEKWMGCPEAKHQKIYATFALPPRKLSVKYGGLVL